MNAKQIKQMFEAMDYGAEMRKWTESDKSIGLEIDEPMPIVAEPAAVPYDLDAPDSEWHDKPITTPQMALDVLKSGRPIVAHIAPLEITATVMHHDEIEVDIFNTETCVDVSLILNFHGATYYLEAFGRFADGAWSVWCPRDPDGAPQY